MLLITVLLSVGTTTVHAGKVLDKVNEVNKRVKTAVSNTNGVQDLVTNVRGVTSGFRSGVTSDLLAGLGEVQDLIAFLKEHRESAGTPADYPDLASLITSLELIMGILQDNPNGGDFGLLSQLLQVLPDKLLAVAGRAASKAGVDGTFINRINQMAIDLAILQEAIKLDEAEQNAAIQTQAQSLAAPVPGTDELPHQTSCDSYNSNRQKYNRAAKAVFTTGLSIRITGEILAGVAKTTSRQNKIGVHGYAGFSIETDSRQAIGKVTAAIGAGVMGTAGVVFAKLKHCEILYHREEIDFDNQQILVNQQQILISNLKVLESNALMLEELCRHTRYRSATCQALQP